MKMYFAISLIIAATASQAVVLDRGSCEDNKPDPPSDMKSAVCLHDCAGYKGLGACGSTWGSCIPDHKDTLIRDSCKKSCDHPDCAEEEDPDFCAIANCLDDAAYEVCPKTCGANSDPNQNSGDCRMLTEGEYEPLDKENLEPLMTIYQTRAFELSFDFLFHSYKKIEKTDKSANLVLVHMSGGGDSSVTPAAYIHANNREVNAHMRLDVGKTSYHGEAKAAGHGSGTFIKSALKNPKVDTWYSMKLSKTKKWTGGYHWEVRLGESDKYDAGDYGEWDDVIWEITDLREEQEHGNVALYVGNDPWNSKLDGLLRNVKYCNLGN